MKVIVSRGREHEADAAMRDDIAALDRRGAKARRVGWRALLAGVVLATGAAIGSFGMSWFAPDVDLESIHVPAAVVHAVEAGESTIGRSGGVFRPVAEAMAMRMPLILKLMALAVGVTLLIQVVALRGALRFLYAVMPLAGLVLLGWIHHLSESVLDEKFAILAKRGQYEAVEKALTLARLPAGDRLQDYVLAQAAVMRAQATGSPLPPAQIESVRAIAADLAAGKTLDVARGTMYVLEARALGSPMSPLARSYDTQARELTRAFRLVSDVTLCSAALIMAFGLAAALGGASMRRRARRLMALLTPVGRKAEMVR